MNNIETLLKERATQLAKPKHSQELQSELLYLRFRLGLMGDYGIDYQSLEEVIKSTQITFVPGAPKIFSGIINRRSDLLPVLDLSELLNLEKTEISAPWIVIIREKNTLAGLLVDNVIGYEDFNKAQFLKSQLTDTRATNHYIKGTYKAEVTMLNTQAIFKTLTTVFNEIK